MRTYKFNITYLVTLIVQCRISLIISTRGDSLNSSEMNYYSDSIFKKIRVQFFLITPKFISILLSKINRSHPNAAMLTT